VIFKDIATWAVIVVAVAGIAAGRLPRLRMDRAGIALAAAAILMALGSIPMDEAFASVDLGTIALLLAMMLVIANLRLAGFFAAAGARALAIARSPRQLLAVVVLASGFLSALFLNDTICLMLTPLVAEICIRSRRDSVPYLIALALSANIGSCATIVGNPQNMLIGAQSGIPFLSFLLTLAPPSIIGLGIAWLVVVIVFPIEFARGQRILHLAARNAPVYRPLLYKSLAASLLMLVLLVAGMPPSIAALSAAAVLLITRRVDPARVFAEVDFSILVFFAGLFVITRTIERSLEFKAGMDLVLPLLQRGGSSTTWLLSIFTALFSNLVSNVPTVMLFRPIVGMFADREGAWYTLALASTFAGNLSLLGSVANLIVAEGARRSGVEIGFWKYLRAGLPVTVLSLAIGTAFLAFVRA
jgi:Na+/H+ antiporter NhaD/arsenite permease-like protein